jgi:hypothetical protein
MAQEISRPSSSIRIVGAPATRLTYATSVNPSPLTVSLPGANPTLGSLVVVITNSTGADLPVQNITFYVPVGGSSTTLTPSSAGIQTAVSDPVHWVFTGPSSPVITGTADYVLGPATGTSVTLAARTSVVVQLYEIQTNTAPGTATITIKEMIGGTPSFGGFSITTFPYGFYFESLAATMLVNSALAPVSQVAYGSQVTLIWNCSVVDTTAYQIYYSTPQGQQPATPTSYDQWLSPPLNSDTVFTLVVTAAVEGGQPVTASLSTSVAVKQPDLVANTVAAQSVSCAGAVTAASVTATGVIQGFGTVPIGAILDWWGPTGSQVQLPANFVVCDGSVISDPQSPFNGQNAPNLVQKFILGVTSPSSIGQTGGSTTTDLSVSVPLPALTGGIPSSAPPSSINQNAGLIVRGNPTTGYRYDLTNQGTGPNLWNDGQHVHSMGQIVTGAGSASIMPPYFCLLKILRIK